MRILIIISTLLFLASCQSNKWEATDSIILEDVSPIGLVFIDGEMLLSDGDNNRLVPIEADGSYDEELIFDDIERPMHIDFANDRLYVPSYGSDAILEYHDGGVDTTDVTLPMDAPAAVAVSGENMAIADFYNHRVLLRQNGKWSSIGKKGKGEGEMHYPTDVQFFDNKLYIADAYNHRIQVWDASGKHLLTFGEDEKMDAASGIWVDVDGVWITDFEQDRILLYDHDGKLGQIIDTGLNKPTDLYKHDGKLYVTNFKGQYVSVYEL